MKKLPKIRSGADPVVVTLSILAAVIGLFSIGMTIAGVRSDDNSSQSSVVVARTSDSSGAQSSLARGMGDASRRADLSVARMDGGRIALVIDDLGGDPASTRRALALPAAVTLAFLPYPPATPALAAMGARAGHEIIAHVPMQADKGAYPGMEALEIVLTPEEITARLESALSRVPFAIGINNHMGSRFTSDATALAPVMRVLKARGLFFFDSKTTPDTKVAEAADRAGVPNAARDVFLDDVQTADAVTAELDRADRIARTTGLATVIGHPHAVTLAVLEGWVARNKARLIPLSEALRLKRQGLQAQR